jgi:hypothetical protein
MPLKKIEPLPDTIYRATARRPCISPEHNPPSHMVMEPGEYEWTCPACGDVMPFTVQGVVWR